MIRRGCTNQAIAEPGLNLSPDNNRDSRMPPGFSEDGESGEEIPGEGMVVLGRGIPLLAGDPELTSGRAVDRDRHGGGGGSGEGTSVGGPLVVSGVKMGEASNLVGNGSFEFPGFSSTGQQSSEAGGSGAAAAGGGARKANGQETGANINDIPFDFM